MRHPTARRRECQRHAVTECRSNQGMTTIGDRVKLRRTQINMSRTDLAKRAGIAYTALSDLELGLTKKSLALHKLAKILNCRTEWLETGKKPIEPENDGDTDWGDIMGYSQAAGLGTGSEGQEYAETHKLKFRADSLAKKRLKPENLSVFYGKGDSMEPRIRSGDAILFDMSDTTPRDGAVFIVMMNGEYYAKRCLMLDDTVYFTTDNPNGDHKWQKPRRMDSKRDPITVVGRVRWIGSWED